MKKTVNLKDLDTGVYEALLSLGDKVKTFTGKELYYLSKSARNILLADASLKKIRNKLIEEFTIDGKIDYIKLNKKMDEVLESHESIEIDIPEIKVSQLKELDLKTAEIVALEGLGIIVED